MYVVSPQHRLEFLVQELFVAICLLMAHFGTDASTFSKASVTRSADLVSRGTTQAIFEKQSIIVIFTARVGNASMDLCTNRL